VNADHYCTLWHLKEVIQMKHPDLLTEKEILLYDNVHTHKAGVTKRLLEQFHRKCLDHSPYSPDVATSDVQLIRPLQKHFEEKHFQCDDKVKAEVCQ
jgi:hypothetical protein